MSPAERDQWYEDGQLKFRLKSGGIDQSDFSKAATSKKLFETFWRLWSEDGKGEYSRSQIAQKYKELFHEDLIIGKIGEIVSNIRSSMINPKPTIKD